MCLFVYNILGDLPSNVGICIFYILLKTSFSYMVLGNQNYVRGSTMCAENEKQREKLGVIIYAHTFCTFVEISNGINYYAGASAVKRGRPKKSPVSLQDRYPTLSPGTE